MYRPFLALLFATPIAVAAPVPKGAKRPNFFPLVLGSKWEYTGDHPHTREVTAEVVSADGATTDYTVTVSGPDLPQQTLVFRPGPDGVLLVRCGTGGRLNDPFLAPVPYLPAALGPKDKWRRTFDTGGEVDKTYHFEVRPPEEVRVNGRGYTATPVRYSTVKTEGGLAGTTWYADGVGIVKDTGLIYRGGSEIKAFTPRK